MSFILVSKCEFSFGGSKPVCICLLMTIQMLKTQRRVGIVIHTKENIGLIYHVYCYLMLFVSGTRIFSNRSRRHKVLYKKSTTKKSVKSTGKHLRQKLPFNKEETLAQVFSCEIRETLKNIPLYRAPRGAASVVTYILKITELPPGLERKIIICLIMWIYVAFMFFVHCSHYIYTKDFY